MAVLALLAACAPPGADELGAAPIAEDRPDDLYRDFLDGKFDGAGHPVGASVFEGETDCGSETGDLLEEELLLAPGRHGAGLACGGTSRRLGRGRQTVNVRAALDQAKCGPECEAAVALDVRVLTESGEVLAERTFDASAFEEAARWQNLAVAFDLRRAGAVSVEVHWLGEVGVRLDYVEVFRQDRQLVLEPRSGVLLPEASFRIEMVDDGETTHEPRVLCNGEDLTPTLEALLADGTATDERTEFRRIVTVPASDLFGECGPQRDVVVELGESWSKSTSEVRYLAEPPPCDFPPGVARVLVTGFVPFPAGSRNVNSSALAVESYDAAAVPEAGVMRLVLPVEFESAAGIVRDVVERCRPDVVVGFGQGRWAVDLETTAYNRRDTSEVAGGVPDNRGVIFDGAPIVPEAPAELATRLPVDVIETALVARGVDAGPSEDPGRYVCNDLFYSTLASTTDEVRAGFVHLPRIFRPTEDDVTMLQTVVAEVVRASVAGLR